MRFAIRYELVTSPFGLIAIAWQGTQRGPLVYRVFLSDHQVAATKRLRVAYPSAVAASCPEIAGLAERIQSFLKGDAVAFNLDALALEKCTRFQETVLVAEYQIPRGWVSTYARLARHLRSPKAARAVGNALAHNPFPIIIPCHRTIRAGGEVGRYQGGMQMKRALLELEGVEFAESGKVITDRIYF